MKSEHTDQNEAPVLVAGTILGVREWSTDRDCEELKPMAVGRPWLISEPTIAKCQYRPHGTHSAPAPGCTCGLHAYHPWSRLASHPGSRSLGGNLYSVAGVIEAWGQVELHADGFRAQFARPVAFVLPTTGSKQDGLRSSIERLAHRAGANLIDPCRGESIKDWIAAKGSAFDRKTVEEMLPEWDPETSVETPAVSSTSYLSASPGFPAKGTLSPFKLLQGVLVYTFMGIGLAVSIFVQVFIYGLIIYVFLLALFGFDPLHLDEGKRNFSQQSEYRPTPEGMDRSIQRAMERIEQMKKQ